ncbi:MAG: tRNA(Ile)-lysidine synthetase, partial [Marinilabiliales bacterium]
KLSDFYKDQKLSLFEKEDALVLCSGNDIIWLPGMRLDDRFKVCKNTKKIIKLVWQDKS